MKMLTVFVAYAMALGIGCARVQVEAPKDPIKLDVSMRLDVYQHVVKDLNEIDSIVHGSNAPKTLGDALVPPAHAGDLPYEAEQAALRRRERLPALSPYLSQGLLAESGGLLESRGAIDAAGRQLMQAENADRMAIYEALARKNGTSVEAVRKVYAEQQRG